MVNFLFDWDSRFTKLINRISGHSPALDWAAITVTHYLVFAVVAVILLRWWSPFARAESRYLVLACGLASAISLGCNQLILLFVQRLRPYESGVTNLIIERNADPSFPSDHATLAFAIAAILLIRKDVFRWPALAMAILISFSRVYVGTHYVSDVLGGAMVGVVAALTVDIIFRRNMTFVQRMIDLF